MSEVPPVLPYPTGRPAGKMFPALQYPNYVKWFVGAIISVIGTWMTSLSLAWVIWVQTHSFLYSGLLGVCFQVPMAISVLIGGVVADRLNSADCCSSPNRSICWPRAALAVMCYEGWLTAHSILIMAVVRGMIMGFDMPARQSFVGEMVSPEAMPSAIALNSAVFNTGRIVGPAVAGVLLATTSATVCFAADAASYGATLIALALMHLAPRQGYHHPPGLGGQFHQLKLGILLAASRPAVYLNLALLAVVSVFVSGYGTVLPAFASNVFGGGSAGGTLSRADILRGGSATFGYLTSAAGVGASLGALCVSAACRKERRGAWMFGGSLASAMALMLLAVAPNLWVAMVIIAAVGFASLCHVSPSNAAVQLSAGERYRGRLISLHGLTFVSMAPLGSMFYGWLAGAASPQWAVAVGGAVGIAGSLALGSRLARLDKAEQPFG